MKTSPDRRPLAPDTGGRDDPVNWELTVAFLRYTIVSVLAASLVICTALVLFAPHQHARIVLSLAFGIFALGATLLYGRGRIKAAFLLLGGGIWGLIVLAMFSLGGTQTAIAQMIPLIILLAGWLINTRAAVAVAILSSLAILAVSFLEQFNLLPLSAQLIPAVRWIIPVFVFGLAALLIHHFVRSYRERLAEVRGLSDELARRSAELQAAAADLNRAQAIASVGSWVYDIPGDTMWLSPETCRIFGVHEGKRGSYAAYVSRAHPEDREALERAWQVALAKGAPFDVEHRITVAGEVRWVRQRAEIEFGADGSPVRAVGTTYDFTDRKVVEDALLLQGERLRIGQVVARMIVMDWEVATDTLIWSDSPEWLRGPLPPGGKYPFYKDQVHPDDLEMWLASRRDWVNNLSGESIDYRLVRTDGQVLWLHSRRTVISGPDGKAARMLVALHDITAHKQAEERLRAALENLGEMICLTDAEDRIVLANRRMVEFNAPVAEYLAPGRKYDEHLRAGIALGMFPDATGREDAWVAERMAFRRESKGAVERRRQDGRWLLVDDQLLADGSVISWGLEITERKLAEETLRNINADLERRVAERTAQLEATNRELESFSYSVSHDLRAPLRAVTGFAKILLEKEGAQLSAEGQRYLGIIDANGRRMGSLIDALLALGRYSRVALSRSEVDMTRLAREACDELAPSWPAAKISVGVLPPAMGNATLLKQVFLNLVGNALKYSANAEAPRVEIRAEGGAYVVSDNGVGFDMAFADKLFKPFERLHSEREFQGTGIGLAIVKLIVERHGGRMQAQGAPGRGADFSFTIPGEP